MSGTPVKWHRSIDTLPDGASIIIANEFFDALPIRQYVLTGEGLCERVVGLDADGALCFGLVLTSAPAATVAAHGAMLEVGAIAQAIMRDLAARLVAMPGALLAIDYGYMRPGSGDTFQALRHHKPHDPLRALGEADLTALVDFTALARAAGSEGAAVYGPIGQGKFLSRLGIFERAASLKRKATPEQTPQSTPPLHVSRGPVRKADQTPAWRSCLRFWQLCRQIFPCPPASTQSQDRTHEGRSRRTRHLKNAGAGAWIFHPPRRRLARRL
ncbi:MAG: SAM-dependent methyltransferase [Methylovirgula sp.]